MECYSEQMCSIFVDGELAVDEARRLRDHLATCQRCRELVDALRAENRVLGESLHELPEEAADPVGFPHLRLSRVWGDLAALAAVLALVSVFFAWVDKLKIPEALEWLNPFGTNGLTNLIFNLSYYFAHGGTAMLADYAAVVGGLFLLLAGGNTVRVEGVVNGDLLAFARTLEVRGSIKGDLVSFAKRTVVSGTVEGRIYNFSQSLDLDGELGHSIYGWVQSLRVDNRGHVGDGIVVGAGDISLEGEVKRSATIFAGNADVSGTIGRDLTMAGGSLTLTNAARVGGNLSARVRHKRDVNIADGASIAGKRDIQVRVRKSQFERPRFYLHQAVWLAAAMLVGWLGLVLFPGFFQGCTEAGGAGWRSPGLGVGVLAGVPVAIVVAAVTLVGIPVSLMLLALYLAAIYLAKIWVGAFLGRMLLKPSGATKRDWLLGLLVGLLILTIVGFIPYLGGLVRLAVVCLGSRELLR